jgi:hypothetical protein
MEEPVTLVSCLFWLARTKWQHSGFPPNYDRYEQWSKNFLSLDANIVIFTDEHYYDAVVERRRAFDPDLCKTKIIKKTLQQLEFYQKYFFKMSVLMSSPQFKNIKHADCADNMYPLYNVVQYNKISLIREVRDLNPFNSTHFMWMDCGSCRDEHSKYLNKKFPKNFDLINDKVIHFTHNYEFNIDEKRSYFLSQIRNIQGTSWIMPAKHVDTYHRLISKELEETMDTGFIGSDEKTYDSIYVQNKDIVQLVKCGWFQFFDIMNQEPECCMHNPHDCASKKTCESAAILQEAVCETPIVTEEQPVQEAVCETPIVTEEQPVQEEIQVCVSAEETCNKNQCCSSQPEPEPVVTVAPPKKWWQKLLVKVTG